jgi:hypothetical protein
MYELRLAPTKGYYSRPFAVETIIIQGLGNSVAGRLAAPQSGLALCCSATYGELGPVRVAEYGGI